MHEVADGKRRDMRALMTESYERLLADLTTCEQRAAELRKLPAGKRRDREARLLQLEREQLDQLHHRLEEVRKKIA